MTDDFYSHPSTSHGNILKILISKLHLTT